MENKEETKEIEKDLQKASDIVAIKDSKGGKLLIDSLVRDILFYIDKLSSSYTTLTLQEFLSISASIKANKDLLSVFTNSKSNKEYLENLLEERLKEE